MRSLLKSKTALVIIFIISVVLSGVSIFVALHLSKQRKADEIDTSAARSIPFGTCVSTSDCQKPIGCCTEGWCNGGTCNRYEDLNKCAAGEICGADCTCQPEVVEAPPEDKKGVSGTTCSTNADCTTSDPNNSYKGCGDCCDSCTCSGGTCVGWRSNERCRLVLNNQSATCAADCTCQVGDFGGGDGTTSCYFKNGAATDVLCDGQEGCPKITVSGDGQIIYTVTTTPNASGGYQICYCDKVQGNCETDCQPLSRSGGSLTRKITSESFPCGVVQADDNEGYCLWKGPNDCSTETPPPPPPPPPPSREMSCDNITRSPTGELAKGQNVSFTASTKDASIVPVKSEFKITLPNKTTQTVVCPKEDPACTLELKTGKYVSTLTYKIPETGDYGVCARFCNASGECTATW